MEFSRLCVCACHIGLQAHADVAEYRDILPNSSYIVENFQRWKFSTVLDRSNFQKYPLYSAFSKVRSILCQYRESLNCANIETLSELREYRETLYSVPDSVYCANKATALCCGF